MYSGTAKGVHGHVVAAPQETKKVLVAEKNKKGEKSKKVFGVQCQRTKDAAGAVYFDLARSFGGTLPGFARRVMAWWPGLAGF